MVIYHFIYKTTHIDSGKYYIGKHSTNNINDDYLGSGILLKKAIEKYGRENFKREILEIVNTSEEAWLLEEKYITKEVLDDVMSFNIAYGGINYIRSLKRNDFEAFLSHQSKAGKKGGMVGLMKNDPTFQSRGGKAVAKIRKKEGTHPFYTGDASSKGGRAVKGMVEMWSPTAKATNKNQRLYKKGDCKKVRYDTEKYKELLTAGWKLIKDHKQSQEA